MRRLIIVSNRLPISVSKRGGKLSFKKSAGGVATGLASFYREYDSLWVGWPGIASDNLTVGEKKEVEEKLLKENCVPIFLSQREIDNYYLGFCNRTLWPLFHYFTQYAEYSKSFWVYYKRSNQNFYNALQKIVSRQDIVWVHDYHLMLLPSMLRKALPEISIGFFLHIPFPSFEVFRFLPPRKEILEGVLGADLIGFHDYDYVRHFLSSIRRIAALENTLGNITINNRLVKADVFPMGIDYERFSGASSIRQVRRSIDRFLKQFEGMKIILSVDRLDYTKGIIQRLLAYELFLKKFPEYTGKVVLILVAVPSRTAMEHYRTLKRSVDELVGRINGEFSTMDWTPVVYLYRFLSFERLNAMYRASDIALITPLRDGMNLIAKEFIASRDNGDGVLILSEMAGAAKELGEALIINPNNIDEMAAAIKLALSMPQAEQLKRNRIMQERLKRYNVGRWARDFLDRLLWVKKRQQEAVARAFNRNLKKLLFANYKGSKRRLIFLDYDGTLVPFATDIKSVRPDKELLSILQHLAEDTRNEIVVTSGRDRKTLENWLGKIRLSFIAEHGVWLKRHSEEWKMTEALSGDWKSEIMPILEFYTDRTPGAKIEEKDFSLVWHYRGADPDLAEVRATELRESLINLVANLDLEVLTGNKVIEIKNPGVDKGKAITKWLLENKPDFILAIGDDWTDEEMFKALPDWAYSIKVRGGISSARFSIESYAKVRILLKELGGLS